MSSQSKTEKQDMHHHEWESAETIPELDSLELRLTIVRYTIYINLNMLKGMKDGSYEKGIIYY